MKPKKLEAEIRAVKDMRAAILSAAKRATKRMCVAQNRYGEASDEYFAAKAGREEADRLLRSLDRLLRRRIDELE